VGVPSPARLFRFGAFQLDLRARELRRNGIKVRVPDQSIQVLAMLLEHPGEVVTREEVHQRLWPNGTIVEFDHSINAAIKRLRQALEDSAEAPQYIETLPRLGYRFIGAVEQTLVTEEAAVPCTEPEPSPGELEGEIFSHYRILGKLGSGGMGVVYRAQDTRLKRTVAIKILPEHLSDNLQARERFQREAHAIASLSHPHICTLHDVGHQDGADFLVMEYLEGETLASRLKKGPLSPDQVLQYSIQITDALDTAHKHGVIHRDLKPGNLMLTKSGVKLLDFGLAKVRVAATAAGATALPTEMAPLTGEGTILGTLQYMAPEQLEGKEADARTDIFALGAVIYEMATGTRAFEGKSHASLVSAIMTAEPPPISTLRTMSPLALDHVVRTCLAKDPDARWQTAHDVLVELQWIAESSVAASAAPRRTRREVVAWTCAGVASLAAAGIGAMRLREQRGEAAPMYFEIPAPPKMRFFVEEYGHFAAVSPDGRQLVWVGLAEGKQLLWLRSLDSPEIRSLPGTDNARLPFWSPDSRFVGFFAGGRLKKINTAEGTLQDLCEASIGLGGAWNRDGLIVFATTYGQPLHRISAVGGEPVPMLDIDRPGGETAQLAPSFLPDSRHLVYWSWRRSKDFICLASTDSRKTRPLIPGATQAMYAPPGFLVFHLGESVLAQPFDTGKLQLTGEPRRLADHADFFSVSGNGVLAYHRNDSSATQFSWYARDGKRSSVVGEPGEYEEFALSADEKRLAVVRGSLVPDIWLLEFGNGVMSRVTFKGARSPVWSPDGRQLIFTIYQNGQFGLYRRVIATGEEELLCALAEDIFAKDWSKDGAYVTLVLGMGLGRLELTGERKPEMLMKTDYDKDQPRLSPDGQWIAYNSTETGRWEIYVAAFPSFSLKRQVSNAGGGQPRWRGDSKELFYLSLDGKLMAVEIKAGSTIETGLPRLLFQTRIRTSGLFDQYQASHDGQRFLLAEPVDEATDAITVVANWTAGLRR